MGEDLITSFLESDGCLQSDLLDEGMRKMALFLWEFMGFIQSYKKNIAIGHVEGEERYNRRVLCSKPFFQTGYPHD